MTRPRSRRRLLAAAAPLALAGCLIEANPDATDGNGQAVEERTETESESEVGDPTTGSGAGNEGTAAQTDDTSAVANASDGENETPDPAGITVESTNISRIIESIYLSQIVADVAIRNSGEYTYGTLELRIDAYYEPPEDDRTYHPPRVDDRTAVGRTYAEETFDSFDTGTRTFENVVIRYDAEEANDSTDPAEFDLEIAVRRAELR
ncbi:hypothetical protein [Halorubrum sp. AJ67]|uniref:hypothetical protein n=1 Tax=Halorubrum sp. AJ67 TaxID=1173487 RepID=UPI0003DCAAB7|nr:hypothetical protein [Halorubrum sp. AJ67]CDK40338.1 putative signal peptide protein [Halorubrum sp. AJ67]